MRKMNSSKRERDLRRGDGTLMSMLVIGALGLAVVGAGMTLVQNSKRQVASRDDASVTALEDSLAALLPTACNSGGLKTTAGGPVVLPAESVPPGTTPITSSLGLIDVPTTTTGVSRLDVARVGSIVGGRRIVSMDISTLPATPSVNDAVVNVQIEPSSSRNSSQSKIEVRLFEVTREPGTDRITACQTSPVMQTLTDGAKLCAALGREWIWEVPDPTTPPAPSPPAPHCRPALGPAGGGECPPNQFAIGLDENDRLVCRVPPPRRRVNPFCGGGTTFDQTCITAWMKIDCAAPPVSTGCVAITCEKKKRLDNVRWRCENPIN